MHAALASTGYLAARSTAVHVSGAASDAQVGNLLAARYCGELTDPQFNDVGAERRGRDAWILLASRAALPGSDAVAVRRQILDLVNQARAGGQRCGGKRFGPAPPLALDATLNAAALAHSKDMAGSGRFDHRGRDGSSPAMRVERAGYGGHLVVGENIAAGPMTPGEVTSGWLERPR